MSDTADRVQKIVVEHLGVEGDKVTQEASFIDDLGADSLDIVELVMAFEEEFGVEIPDDAAEKDQRPWAMRPSSSKNIRANQPSACLLSRLLGTGDTDRQARARFERGLSGL